ncbi:MAG: hypothetical protein PHP96_00120 [Candidatus Dojkabacteria bacterium]|nr:hypothetical protein [Candidatus Dojkabacteria bacterium]MDD4561160.1 hypothetical protein [Candidatus Dojkabacteria bacterium]
MKSFIKKAVILLLLLSQPLSLYAQEMGDIEVEPLTEQGIIEGQAQEEEEGFVSLSEKLEEKEEIEEPSNPPMSFLTILGAILIPSIFIILSYFILKFFKF